MTMSLDENNDTQQKVYKLKHALPMFKCSDIISTENNDLLVVDKLKKTVPIQAAEGEASRELRQSLLSVVSTKRLARGNFKKQVGKKDSKPDADTPPAFSSDNLLMFDEQEQHAMNHQSVIIPSESCISIFSVNSEANGTHTLYRYDVVKMTVDELIDHYLNADDLLTAQSIISKYGLK